MKLTTIVDRYVFKEALGLYVLGLTGFLAFLVINQIFLEWNLHYGPGVEFSNLMLLVLYRVPEYTVLSIPIAVLFATLMSMGRLGKDNELTAIFTNGISLYRLFLPFLYLALPNVLLSFYISDQWVPWANVQSQQVLDANPALRENVQESDTDETFDPLITRLGDRYLAAKWLNRETGRTGEIIIDDLGGVMSSDVGQGPRAGVDMAGDDGPDGEGESEPEGDEAATGGEAEEQAQPDEGNQAAEPGAPRAPPEQTDTETDADTEPGDEPDGDPQPDGEDAGPETAGETPRRSGESSPSRKAEDTQFQLREGPGGGLVPQVEGLESGQGEVETVEQTGRTGEELGEADASGHRLLFGSSGRIEGDLLTLINAWEYVVDEEGNLVEARNLGGSYEVELERPLTDIYSQIRDPEELTRDQLQRLVSESEELGLNTARAKTQLYLKYSKPFAPLFLALIGMPLSLRAPRDERMLGLILTYALVFVYYLIYFVGRLLGFNGIVHPFLAAWTHNIVYAAAAFFIFMTVRK